MVGDELSSGKFRKRNIGQKNIDTISQYLYNQSESRMSEIEEDDLWWHYHLLSSWWSDYQSAAHLGSTINIWSRQREEVKPNELMIYWESDSRPIPPFMKFNTQPIKAISSGNKQAIKDWSNRPRHVQVGSTTSDCFQKAWILCFFID